MVLVKKYYLLILICAAILNPSLLVAEERPGFYSSEPRRLELSKYEVSLITSNGGSSTNGISTNIRCVGDNCASDQFAYSGTSKSNTYGFGFVTPHLNKLSLGVLVNSAYANSTNSNETWSGTNTSTNINTTKSINLNASYLLSPNTLVVGSIMQDRSSFANQTQHIFDLKYYKQVNSNLSFSGNVGGLLWDDLLPNGVKHVGGSLNYARSLDQVDLNGFFNLARATTISRSQVSGIPTASEDRYNKMGSGGSIHIKHDASKFGLIGNFSVSDREGSPRDVSFGPQYIYTAPDFEISLTGNYMISRLNNIAKPNNVVNYSDNVTKELRFRYVREIQDGYFLDSSILKSWNSNGSNIIGSEVQSESDAELWSLNFGVSRLF